MTIPHLENKAGTTHFIVDGKPFLALAGELHNSTSASRDYAAQYWKKLQDMNLNTVILGVSWELVEPEEGVFDFSIVDGLLEDAWTYGMKVIPIWFATWKNAASTYTPEWVQSDFKRFPRALHIDGRKNAAISCFSEECCRLDARAFGRLMAHIREVDIHQCVIAVQVENESGVLGTARDYAPTATQLFEGEIPTALTAWLTDNVSSLEPSLRRQIRRFSGTWKEVFPEDGEEAFMCFYTAKYINRVVEAGKAAYPLPMFVNAWPEQCRGEAAGFHPSGGATSRMLDIWKCAAPGIDFFAGDLYLENFAEECEAYTRLEGNPLFIPEARKDKWVMAHAFYAFGNHDALCFSPFGIESIERENVIPENMLIQSIFQTMEGGDTSSLVRQTYGILGNLTPVLCKYRGTGKMKGFLQNRLMDAALAFSKYTFRIYYQNYIDRIDIPGGGLIIELNPDEFLIAGANFTLVPLPKPDYPAAVELLALEEGRFQNGSWVRERRLNGDELHLTALREPRLLRVKLLNF